ncbi:CDP-glycerol glycerophosphotransferase family protein [Leclercia sp. W6]|uniref:CDP-glycerol glycerophosphotransferase family protein n=1 Tax=Leclercia sp. W6 TaxID=2282310 RepID=UPI001FEFF420|nr:CDP-glycerol glycerophosphotransferase family protein [Leclercia sp. W6]
MNSTLDISHIRLFSQVAHLLHTGEGVKCAFHLELWVGEFISSGQPFAILIRNQELYKWALEKYPYLDIVYAKTALDVESVLSKLPFLKAIYYFSNTGNLIHTLRFNIYQHIFLGHGDSDKAASAHKFFRVYDEIWVAGQAHIDRFKNANFNVEHIKFVKVGRPSLKFIVSKSVKEVGAERKVTNLTYFPTWEGAFEENNYSSAHLSAVMLSELQHKLDCTVVAKYHPLTASRDITLSGVGLSLEQALADKPFCIEVVDKTVPVEKLIIKADMFICDISAVVSECISSLMPIFIYIPTDREVVTSKSDMQYSDYAYVYSNIPQLIELVDRVIIQGDDYLSEARYKALDYLLSINETISDEFHKQLKRVNSDNSLMENKREQIIL